MQIRHIPMALAGGLVCLGGVGSAAAIPLKALTLGAGEKGLLLAVETSSKERDQLELGLQIGQAQVAQIDAGLSSPIPVEVSSAGVRLAYNRYLMGRADQGGPFLQAALSVQRLSAQSVVDLGDLTFNTGGLAVTCSSCGSVTFKTRSPVLNVIPAVGVGWQAVLSSKLRLKVLAGVQYYDVPSVAWSSERNLPKFAEDALESAERQVNSQIEALGDFYPTVGVAMTYVF